MSDENEAYPFLKDMTDADLVAMLGEYVRVPSMATVDAAFIKALQDELKTRSGKKRLDLPT